jgi:hypothetical protein
VGHLINRFPVDVGDRRAQPSRRFSGRRGLSRLRLESTKELFRAGLIACGLGLEGSKERRRPDVGDGMTIDA